MREKKMRKREHVKMECAKMECVKERAEREFMKGERVKMECVKGIHEGRTCGKGMREEGIHEGGTCGKGMRKKERVKRECMNGGELKRGEGGVKENALGIFGDNQGHAVK